MSNRPTVNLLESHANAETGQFNAVPRFRDLLEEHGYVIVHPDDIPPITHDGWTPEPSPDDGSPSYWVGWNSCRAYIFGDDS